MQGQMSISDYLIDQTHDRNGKLYQAPEWMPRQRCETCRFWEILPAGEQPPNGWGVKGQCNRSHAPEMMAGGYWKTGKTSYCQEYEVTT